MSIGAVGGGSSMISSLLMKALDQDKSGTASLEEFTSVGQSVSDASFDQSEEALSTAFSSLDQDGDGSLTESEIAQGLAKFSQESASALLGAQEAGGPPPPPPGGESGGFFAEADSDDSGTVSLDEFTSAGPQSVSSEDAAAMFSQIDSDGDGEISSDEDQAFREARGMGGPQGGPPPAPPSDASASAEDSDDEEDATTELLASLSEIMSAQTAYASSSTSALDEALSSLFSSAA